jgi:hypothetical protein
MKILLGALLAVSACAQTNALLQIRQGRPVVDAHNCYPYEGKFPDRIERALSLGFPVGIEQDLAWYADASGHGQVVVSHTSKTKGAEPSLREHFFERVRPIIEKALRENDRSKWPLIVVHFDVKDNREPLLRAVWEMLGEYQGWLTTAVKGHDPSQLAPFDWKPLLVLTEDNDAQERVFFNEVPEGAKMRLFGSAHTNTPRGNSREETVRLIASAPPEALLTEKPSNYRRWWNNSWFEVEEGGQQHAGEWTAADAARLKALVDHAHKLGYWIRFYTLDGFKPEDDKGWGNGYNFGSRQAVEARWKAALEAGVNLIATDQYEDLAAFARLHDSN